MKIRKLILGILSLMLLFSCASAGSYKTVEAVSVPLGEYMGVQMQVESDLSDTEEAEEILKVKVLTKLKMEKLFNVVSLDNEPGTSSSLKMDIRIVEIKKVSSFARIMFGALAGKAKVVVEVELTDLMTGNNLGKFTAEGKSSGGTVFAGTTDEGFEMAAVQIVDFIKANI